MTEYNGHHFFYKPNSNTPLNRTAYLSSEAVNIIDNTLRAFENSGLFVVDAYQYYVQQQGFSNSSILTNVVMASHEEIIAKLKGLTLYNPDKVCGFIFLGFGVLFSGQRELQKKELLRLAFGFDGRSFFTDFDARDWLPAYLTYNEDKDDYDCIFQFEQHKANKGRLEAALLAVERQAGLKSDILLEFDTEPDWGYATEGYSLYVPRRVWKIILQQAPNIDILPYLSPSEAQSYLSELLSPKIDKLRNITRSRPLLAREQLELDSLTHILSCGSVADIDLIINNLQNTPTDPDLRQRLLHQAQNKKNILLEQQLARGLAPDIVPPAP